jgi:hypothetical protein
MLTRKKGDKYQKVKGIGTISELLLHFLSGNNSTPKNKRKGAFLLLFLGLQRY